MIVASTIQQLIQKGDFYHYIQGLFNSSTLQRIGGEILFRSGMGNPDEIFTRAKKENKLYELDTKSIEKIFYNISLQEDRKKEFLFINIFPSTVLHEEFPYFINKISLLYKNIIQNIVFEIIETDYVNNINLFKKRINLIKSLGYSIAIDDVGKGWSSLNIVIELEPNYLKLDQYFASNLSQSKLKQEMITSLVYYAHNSNSKVVLEGIEHERDLKVAIMLGVDLCQGYLLEIPKPIFP